MKWKLLSKLFGNDWVRPGVGMIRKKWSADHLLAWKIISNPKLYESNYFGVEVDEMRWRLDWYRWSILLFPSRKSSAIGIKFFYDDLWIKLFLSVIRIIFSVILPTPGGPMKIKRRLSGLAIQTFSIAIMVRLEGTFDWHSQIVGLPGRQFFKLHAQFLQMQSCHLFVQLKLQKQTGEPKKIPAKEYSH